MKEGCNQLSFEAFSALTKEICNLSQKEFEELYKAVDWSPDHMKDMWYHFRGSRISWLFTATDPTTLGEAIFEYCKAKADIL